MVLSIIIALYNAEQYVLECLKSIDLQLNKSIEVIIVNDSSQDNSLIVVQNFVNSSTFSANYKVFSFEKNMGVGYVRTFATQQSKGKYIVSIDPDDIIRKDYIQKISNVLINELPDIVQFHINRFEKDIEQSLRMSKFPISSGMHNLDGKLKQKIYEQSFWSFCTRVIKRDLIDGLDFSMLRNCEDVYALPLVLLKANFIYYLDEEIYYYRYSNISLSKSSSKFNIINTTNSYLYIIHKYIHLIESGEEQLYYAVIPIIGGYLDFCLKNYPVNYSYDEWYKFKKSLKKNNKQLKPCLKVSHNFLLYGGVTGLRLFNKLRGLR